MKFLIILKKELKDLITLSTLAGLAVALIMFLLLGNFISSVNEDMVKEKNVVAFADKDNTLLSNQIINSLKTSGVDIRLINGADDFELMERAKEQGQNSYTIIEKGFEEKFSANKQCDIRIVNKIESFSMTSTISSGMSANIAQMIKESLSDIIIAKSDISPNTEFVKNPVNIIDTTISKGKSQNVSSALLSSFAMQQTIFVPIIVFLLITFATQMTISTIANEKGDKTLETLLSAPVSRLSVLMAKMCAAGLLSLLMAGVFMFGFSRYMGGMMGGALPSEQMSDVSLALNSLGLNLGVFDYVLVGIQLFLTILIALGFSTVLGAISKDLKSAQGLVGIIMVMAMVPYFITMFSDVNMLPIVPKVLISLIPFTHTFTATGNLIFGNYTMFFGGMIYQVIALIIVLGFAVKIFSSDLIFTMTLDLSAKRRKKS
ncbi:MAG: ABC transporter permease [Oscillospiraceae bacterium]